MSAMAKNLEGGVQSPPPTCLGLIGKFVGLIKREGAMNERNKTKLIPYSRL